MELSDLLKYIDEVLKQPVMDLELFARKQQVLNNCLVLAPPMQLQALVSYLRNAIGTGDVDRFDGEAYLLYIEALTRGERPNFPELSNYQLRYSPFVLDTLESSSSNNSSLELSPVLASADPPEQPSEIISTGTNLWALYLNKQPKDASLNSGGAANIAFELSKILTKQLISCFFAIKHYQPVASMRSLQGMVKVLDFEQRNRRKVFGALRHATAPASIAVPLKYMACARLCRLLERQAILLQYKALKQLKAKPSPPHAAMLFTHTLASLKHRQLRHAVKLLIVSRLNLVETQRIQACYVLDSKCLKGTLLFKKLSFKRLKRQSKRRLTVDQPEEEGSKTMKSLTAMGARFKSLSHAWIGEAFEALRKYGLSSAENSTISQGDRLTERAMGVALAAVLKPLLRGALCEGFEALGESQVTVSTGGLVLKPSKAVRAVKHPSQTAEALLVRHCLEKVRSTALRNPFKHLTEVPEAVKVPIGTPAASAILPQSAHAACKIIEQVARRCLRVPLKFLTTNLLTQASAFLYMKLLVASTLQKAKAFQKLKPFTKKVPWLQLSAINSPNKSFLDSSSRFTCRERLLVTVLNQVHCRLLQRHFDRIVFNLNPLEESAVNQSQLQLAIRTYRHSQLKRRVIEAFIHKCRLKVEQHAVWRWSLAISDIRRRKETMELALVKLNHANRAMMLEKAMMDWVTTKPRKAFKSNVHTPRSTTITGGASFLYHSRVFRIKLAERLIENSRCSIEQMALWKWSLASQKAKKLHQKTVLLRLKKLLYNTRRRVLLGQWASPTGYVPRGLRIVLEKANIRHFYMHRGLLAKLRRVLSV